MAAHPVTPKARGPIPFQTELQGLPIVATATFCAGKCRHVNVEGTVPSSEGRKTEAAGASGHSQKDNNDEQYLISRSLAAAEKTAVAFLAAEAKASAAEKEEEADTVGNDRLGLDDD